MTIGSEGGQCFRESTTADQIAAGNLSRLQNGLQSGTEALRIPAAGQDPSMVEDGPSRL